jgi:hypothetical protein
LRRGPGGGLAAWPPAAPLFMGADGGRISRGTLQYRVLRAFRRAGIDADRARGALVHARVAPHLCTEPANSEVSVYTLMKLLVTTEMTLRYASLAAPTIRIAYEEAMSKTRNRLALTSRSHRSASPSSRTGSNGCAKKCSKPESHTGIAPDSWPLRPAPTPPRR